MTTNPTRFMCAWAGRYTTHAGWIAIARPSVMPARNQSRLDRMNALANQSMRHSSGCERHPRKAKIDLDGDAIPRANRAEQDTRGRDREAGQRQGQRTLHADGIVALRCRGHVELDTLGDTSNSQRPV